MVKISAAMIRFLLVPVLFAAVCLGAGQTMTSAAAADEKPSGAAEIVAPYATRPPETLTFPPGVTSMRVTPIDVLTEEEWDAAVRAGKGAPFGFAQLPDPASLDRHYPPAARANGITGQVLDGCIVDDAEGRVRCLVLKVDPPGMLFELHGLRILQEVRIEPRDAEGKPTIGRAVEIPMDFTLPE